MPNRATGPVRDRYYLSFIEIDENPSRLFDSKQVESTIDLINSKNNVFVIVYIHGWRHNADVADSDIQKFRTLLAYSREFLNQRPGIDGSETELIGIYVGWRGRTQSKLLNSVLFAPTVWSRKTKSDEHASLLIDTLRQIESTTITRSDKSAHRKMLTYGHSFGGNMLLTGLLNEEKVISQIADHSHGRQFPRTLGDLVLLINPASEASKWIAIQEAMNERVDAELSRGRSERLARRRLFPLEQKPRMIAMTATCDWSEGELKRKKSARCDSATDFFFPMAWFFKNKRDKTAVGHYKPNYEPGEIYSRTDPYGASHEIILNYSAGKQTSLSNVNKKDLTKCDVANGWLLRAREIPELWDSGSNKRVQFRRGLSLPGGGGGTKRSIVPYNSPFWNARVLNAVENHGDYVSYPTWCAVNQLVLDDVTAK
ncbi:hypothetical protein B7H23_11505 [Notoacmeibacter marinus]|uniref:Alpha/beta hydrolase n=2 Tax=Notoacmeibacter marinus TaxID=1876515 RepID=A0A231UXN6_9HYPH|nr:hypothetical protein B7H23_11505 [Notoacmeibacter marinus]